MGSEIERRMPEGSIAAIPDVLGPAGLPSPRHLAYLTRLANQIASTSMVPKGMRNRPPEVLAAFLYGWTIGVPPMIAIRVLDVIDGGVSESGAFSLARIIEAGHWNDVRVYTADECTIDWYRADRPDHPRTLTWTKEMAVAAGLATKQNWQGYGQQMLLWRNVGDASRQVYPDLFLGVRAYTPEELGAIELDAQLIEEVGGDSYLASEVAGAEYAQQVDVRGLPAQDPSGRIPVVDVTAPPLDVEKFAVDFLKMNATAAGQLVIQAAQSRDAALLRTIIDLEEGGKRRTTVLGPAKTALADLEAAALAGTAPPPPPEPPVDGEAPQGEAGDEGDGEGPQDDPAPADGEAPQGEPQADLNNGSLLAGGDDAPPPAPGGDLFDVLPDEMKVQALVLAVKAAQEMPEHADRWNMQAVTAKVKELWGYDALIDLSGEHAASIWSSSFFPSEAKEAAIAALEAEHGGS